MFPGKEYTETFEVAGAMQMMPKDDETMHLQ